MSTGAAVMTGPGVGAIATIGLCGTSAPTVLAKVFRLAKQADVEFRTGRILLGHLVDGAHTIDQVTIGCEAPERFAIHCHGNPLIVEAIMKLLQRHGVEVLPPEQLHARVCAAEEGTTSLEIEARLALTTVKTVAGARLVANQTAEGVGQWCRKWQTEPMSLDRIKEEVAHIQRASEIARRIISGCTIVLIGPPNTGKSTLLNTLAGREKAIVTDIEGTTRDWISAEIHMAPLAATVIDTAGLAGDLAGGIDQAAQARSVEMLQRADLVLLVLDASRPDHRIEPGLLNGLSDKKTLVVLNKTDLSERLDTTLLPPQSSHPVRISAQQNTGIDTLIETVHLTLGVTDFDPHTPVAFTDRQRDLLAQIGTVSSPTEADAIIAELLGGAISV